MREYVPIFFDWMENTQDLTDEEKGRLIDAVIMYASGEDGWEERLQGAEKIAFRFMRGQVDRNDKISKARSEAGSSKKEQTQSNDNKNEQTETNEIKTEQTETKILKEEKKEKEKKEKEDISQRFDKFWVAYPNKKAKQDALRAFQKLKPDDDLLNRMLAALEREKESAQWQESGGRFVPHPATWLNGRRWEDETTSPTPAQAARHVVAQDYPQRDYEIGAETPDQVYARLFGDAG